jgi:rubrerythrin
MDANRLSALYAKPPLDPEVIVKRNFSSLTGPEALRIAIAIEDRNAETYRQLADLFSHFCPESLAIASTFCELADTERQHSVALSTRYFERFGTVNAGIAEEDIRDFIEVPRFEVADIVAAVETGSPGSARRIALEIAAAAERSALHYYERLAALSLDLQMKSLYQEFAAFEQEHTDWLETELASKYSDLSSPKVSVAKSTSGHD